MDAGTKNVMAEYGAAVHDGQVLESMIELILLLLDMHRLEDDNIPTIGDALERYNKKTLGTLIWLLKNREEIDVSSADAEKLRAALDERNELVHRFFRSEEQLTAALLESRQEALVADLSRRRNVVKEGNQVSDKILDNLLSRHDLSINELIEQAEHHIAKMEAE